MGPGETPQQQATTISPPFSPTKFDVSCPARNLISTGQQQLDKIFQTYSGAQVPRSHNDRL